MPNKHFCQGTNCHTNPTSDRFLKSKGIIRGRYAYAEIATSNNEDKRWHRYDYRSDTYFCSQGCMLHFIQTHIDKVIAIAPSLEALETPIDVVVETRFDWQDNPYKTKVIKEVDNSESVG